MTTQTIKIHNVETGEIVERDMTKAEKDQLAIDQTGIQLQLEIARQKAAEKAALLAKLGISAEEAALLLS